MPSNLWPCSLKLSDHSTCRFLASMISCSKTDRFTKCELHLLPLQSTEMEAALKTFFSSSRFAVAGASSDPTKFGHKGKKNQTLRYSIPTIP
jgi:hypothetical protein